MHTFRISIGADVEWTSQAGGCDKTKKGIVVAHVQAGKRISYIPGLEKIRILGQDHSLIPRYLVRVPSARSVKYYTPSAYVLEAQNGGK